MERIRVLIADDFASVRDALQVSLGSMPDLEVTVAGADDVSAAFDATRPHVVLLEPKSFGDKGLTLCHTLLAAPWQPEVVVLTSWRDEREEVSLTAMGVRHYLLKDIDSTRLYEEILSVFSQRQNGA